MKKPKIQRYLSKLKANAWHSATGYWIKWSCYLQQLLDATNDSLAAKVLLQDIDFDRGRMQLPENLRNSIKKLERCKETSLTIVHCLQQHWYLLKGVIEIEAVPLVKSSVPKLDFSKAALN